MKNAQNIKIYTTRPETIFGVSYLVISPEHEIIKKINNQITNIQEVQNNVRLKVSLNKNAVSEEE